MSKIFLSYRRDDSAAYAGRLYDRLAAHFGRETLFMDIDHIEPGEDFVEVIKDSVGAASVLILLIGRQWVSLIDPTGARRLDNPDDFVRLELGAALDKKIRIIPVLVGGACVPRVQDLPEPLQPLARRQAIDITDTRFHSDVDRLIEVIERGLRTAAEQDAQPVTTNAAPGQIAPQPMQPQTVSAPTSDKRQDRPVPPDPTVERDDPSLEPKLRFQGALGFNLKLFLSAVAVLIVVFVLGVLALRKSNDAAPAIDPNQQNPTVAEFKPPATPTAPAYTGQGFTLRGQDTYSIKYAHSAAFRALAGALKKMSAGSIKLEQLPAGAVVPAFATMDAVAKGTLDSAWVSPAYFYGKNTAFALIDSPPFGPKPLTYVQWRQDENVDAAIDALYRSFGVKSIFCGVIGPYADLWSTVKIRVPSDLLGRKLRAVGIRIDIFTKAGAAVNALPAGEIVPAMERRIIDGAHFVEPASGVEMSGLGGVTRFLYYPGTLTPAAGLDLIINAGKWDQLPREAQNAMERACKRNVQEMLDKNEAEQRAPLSALASKGVQVEPLPAAVVSALRTVWQKVAAEKSSNPLFVKLLDSIRAFERSG